jgi:hypothetical protein
MARRALLAAMTMLTLGVAVSEAAAPASAGVNQYESEYANGAKVICNEFMTGTSTWEWKIPNVPTHKYTFIGLKCPKASG